jgi:hypothetical protein
MTLRFWPIALALGLLVSPVFGQPNEIRKSVARINSTSQDANYRTPWLPGGLGGGSGTGWVVSKDRLVMNAHVVSNARFLTVEKNDRNTSPRSAYRARRDLALVKVQDPAFFKGSTTRRRHPELTNVTVIGYPIGGERISVTRALFQSISFHAFGHRLVSRHPDRCRDQSRKQRRDAERQGGESPSGLLRRRGAKRRLHDSDTGHPALPHGIKDG